MRHVPLERRVGLTTQSGNISMTTVLAEGDATALRALCATDFAAECFCGAWNDAAMSGTVRASSEASGCGDGRRGRCFGLRTGLRNFLRVSEAMRRQFCLLCAHTFLICGVAQRMKGTSPSRGCDWVVANGIKRAMMEFLDFINTYRRGKS